MVFDTIDDWVGIYSSAGLVNVETQTGPFEMMTPRGFLADEGPAHSLAIMTRVATRPANIRKMTWLMPRMAKAVPYLGYVLVASEKPRSVPAGSPRARSLQHELIRHGEPRQPAAATRGAELHAASI
jgi:hypothetical protein